jgi:Pectate lyase superfamily protein
MGSTVNGIYIPDDGENSWGTQVSNNLRRQSENHVNVKAYGALGDGTTDDSTAFTNALTAAGEGGHTFVPSGTYILNNLSFTNDNQRIVGEGKNKTILKLKAAGSYILREVGLWGCSVENLQLDGNSKTGAGIVLTGSAVRGSQRHRFVNLNIRQCTIGVDVQAGAANQVDRNTYQDCYIFECNTGMKVNSANGQEQVFLNTTVSGCTTAALELDNGSLDWFGGQCLSSGKGIHFASGAFLWLNMRGVILEGNTTDIEGTTWPTYGVIMEHSVTASAINIAPNGSKFTARNCIFNAAINANGNDVFFLDENCTFGGGGSWNAAGGNVRRMKIDGSGFGFNQPTGSTTDSLEWGAPGAAAMDTNLYRSAANRLKTDDNLHAVDGVATKYKAGTPVDGDFATTPPDGTIVVDSSANKIWTRIGGTWKGVVVA